MNHINENNLNNNNNINKNIINENIFNEKIHLTFFQKCNICKKYPIINNLYIIALIAKSKYVKNVNNILYINIHY